MLQRAALPMPTVVKTLDGIHLATALLLRERRNISLTFATHDDQQATAARALGFDFVGVNRTAAIQHARNPEGCRASLRSS